MTNTPGSASPTIPCVWCGDPAVTVVLDLGAQPPADLFPVVAAPGPEPTTPLQLSRCEHCGLAQLLEDAGVAEEALGVEPDALVRHAERAVATIDHLVRDARTFAEFDSPHGGGWRALMAASGPQDRTGSEACVERVDLVVDVFGLMHEHDQRSALHRRADRLAEDGVLLVQYHSVATIVAQRQWNALRHGHRAYYSTAALCMMLAEVGLHPFEIWEFDLYGGTLLLAAAADARPQSARLLGVLDGEDEAVSAAGLATLGRAAEEDAAALRSWLAERAAAGALVLGYGAASRAVPLITRAGVTPELLPAVADRSELKWGRRFPTSGLAIISPDDLVRRDPDDIVLFVPDLAAEVRAALPGLRARWWVTEPVLHRIDAP